VSQVFVSNLPMVMVAVEAAGRKALSAACDVGRNQVVKNLQNIPPRTGEVYRLPRTVKGPRGSRASYLAGKAAGKIPGGVLHKYYTASAAGEYPAWRFGYLAGNIYSKIVGGTGYVGTNVEYALPLEKKPPSKGGREFMRPSLNQAKPGMLVQLGKRWF
jgi:hypothetical protein